VDEDFVPVVVMSGVVPLGFLPVAVKAVLEKGQKRAFRSVLR
jgi:hypothetical protein